MNIFHALNNAAASLKESGIESNYIDSRLLLSHILNKPIEYLLSNSSEELSKKYYQKFLKAINRRLKLEPIAYILGYKEFYGHKFDVEEGVLIPRPDTETLIEAIFNEYNTYEELQILELGVGSGCIIITLLLMFQRAKAIGSDISQKALFIAEKNAKNHQISNRLKLIRSNWFEDITRQKFDLIVSNPPYISKYDRNLVSKSALLFEPYSALFADDKGFSVYKKIANEAKYFLKKNGRIFLEVGVNQVKRVENIFNEAGYYREKIYNDLAGRERIISFKQCD